MAERTKTAYSSNFFDSLSRGTRPSAQAVVPTVYDMLKPASVLDVGCGVGTWLSQWSKAGVSDFLGIDGDYVDRAALEIPQDNFQPVDLQKPFSLGRTFDLVQTFEVAEHLDAVNADAFVNSLIKHGDTILFSAAIPGQGGTHHVNEQWPSYWKEKFAKVGYTCYDVVRPLIWNNPDVLWFYRQNILIFSRERTFEAVAPAPFDIVHPEMYQRTRMTLGNAPGLVASLLGLKPKSLWKKS